MIVFFAERFPKCFFDQWEKKPLKIGIDKDLFPIKDELKYSERQIECFLFVYTNNDSYEHCLAQHDATRIDLNGEPVEMVTNERKKIAQEISRKNNLSY